MASSVEGRDPFLDHRLVEFVVALPPQMKYRERNGKYVLKRAMRGTLPDEILDRRKQGFGTPMPEWLRGRFGELAERTVMSSALRERGLLDMDQVVRLFAAHRAGRGDWSYHLWNLYSVSAWYDRWVAGRPASADRGRAGRDVRRRVRWLEPHLRPPTTSTLTRRRRHGDKSRHRLRRLANRTKLVSCGTKNAPGSEPTHVTGLFSANSVWNRSDVALAAAGRSTARPRADAGGRERDQGGDRTVDRDRATTALRCTWLVPISAAYGCTSMSPRPTARR